ncbi:MAG TPA: ElyC/SanA/YdcF family protein [Cyclobacteriaceae bacterium]|nr:ElyC/SanA/YdcF family protein [Cyclobacteriaceae bacterium]
MFWRRVTRGVLITFVSAVLLVWFTNLWVVNSTSDKVFSSTDALPTNGVAVVLGTSHKLASGKPNPFFEYRIKMAATLYASGKVRHFIVSGDNRTRYYNEPLEMKKALVKSGVPDSVITLDYAGLRTLDTIVRCKEIFGQDTITIITQPFHCYRALFISNYYNMNAVAVMTEDPNPDSAVRVRIREYFARARAVLDLYVFKTPPRHLGDKEPIKNL